MLRMTSLPAPFHEWLKRRRRSLDLSVELLAERAGCSPNTLRKLESGERRPSRQLAEHLARHLAILPDELPAFLDYARSGTTEAPPLPAACPRRQPPPRPLTRLIGRDALLAELRGLLLEQGVPLVSLLGPAGVGKTRLALELAAELHEAFPDGALVVPLAALRDPVAALGAIAEALELD